MENFGLETTQHNQSTMPVSQFLFMRPDEDRDRQKDKNESERERETTDKHIRRRTDEVTKKRVIQKKI